MQQRWFTLALALGITACQSPPHTSSVPVAAAKDRIEAPITPIHRQHQQAYSRNLIIMYDTQVGKQPLLAAVKAYPAQLVYDYSIIAGIAIHLADDQDIQHAMAYFSKVKGVVNVQRDAILTLDGGASLGGGRLAQ